MKKVSIIIPVYNGEKYIKRCLESIIKQTYRNLEIVIVNDGSTDNTLDIIRKIKDKRIVIFNNSNKGVSYSRNYGLSRSNGEYIIFVDADDWLEYDAIFNMVNIIEKEEADAVRTNYYINNEYRAKRYDYLYNSQINLKDNLIKTILNGKTPAYLWILMLKRELLYNIEFREDIFMMEDTIFYIEVLKNIKKIAVKDIYTYHYYTNDNSLTRSQNIIPRVLNIIEVEKVINSVIENDYSCYLKDFENGIVNTLVVEFNKIISKSKYEDFNNNLNELEEKMEYNNYFKSLNKKNLTLKNKMICLVIYNHRCLYFLLNIIMKYRALKKIIYKKKNSKPENKLT